MDWIQIVEMVGAAITGGGLAGLLLVPEKKSSARLDNAERIIAKYEGIISSLEAEAKEKDEKIEKLQEEVRALKDATEELKTKLKTLTVIGREDHVLRCENTGCKRRKPKLNRQAIEELK